MRRDIKSLPFFILGTFVLLVLSNCKPVNETKYSKEVVQVTQSSTDTCNPANYKYPTGIAIEDSSIYNTVIDIITPPSVYASISNPTVGYFPVSLENIEKLKQMDEKCEILPGEGSDVLSWFYLALKPGKKPAKDTITLYFVCYKGKKDEDNHCVSTNDLIFFDLGNPNKLIRIPSEIASDHMQRFQKYIDKRIKSLDLELFYPYGFQLPWCDLLAVGENVGTNKDNRVHCVLVIKSKRDDPSVPAVSMLIRTFKQNKPTQALAEEGDDDGYYDFMFPCPNSCIP